VITVPGEISQEKSSGEGRVGRKKMLIDLRERATAAAAEM